MTVAPGSPAPPFVLPSAEGTTVGSEDLFGRQPTVLVFFKSTCPTCKLAFPVYGDLARRAGGAASVVAVAQDPHDVARPWLDGLGFDAPVVDDSVGGYAVSRAYGVDTVPTAFLVGPGGQVLDVVVAWDRDGVNRLAAGLAEAAGTDPAPVSTEADGRPAFKPG